MSETKKRLLLSKWRSQVETLHEIEDRLQNLIADRDTDIERLKEELQEVGRDGIDWYTEQLEAALIDVKYWLHDGLVMHRLVSDPRRLLRKVEDALS